MGRSQVDYDFNEVEKPCLRDGDKRAKPTGQCATEGKCQWFEYCDLPQKNPALPPTKPKIGRMPC